MPEQTPPISLPQTGFVRERSLRPSFVPVSHTTLWLMVKEGRFPRPVKLSPGVTAWRCADVHAWIAAHSGEVSQ